jgi:hypothetical protein
MGGLVEIAKYKFQKKEVVSATAKWKFSVVGAKIDLVRALTRPVIGL